MKKTLGLLLGVLLAVSLASCDKDKKEEVSKQPEAKTEQATKTPNKPDVTEAEEGQTEDKKDEAEKQGEMQEGTTEEKEEEKKPTPEEGQPYVAKPGSEMQGKIKLEAEWVPFETPVTVESIFNANMTKVGDKYYIMTGKMLKEYEEKDGKLVFVKETELPQEYKTIAGDKNGVVYISDFISDLKGFKDGEQIFQYSECHNHVAVHSSGKWGMLYSGFNELHKITFKDDTVKLKKIKSLKGLDKIGDVFIGKDYIFVTGRVKKGEAERSVIGVYDFDLKKKYILGSTKEGIHPDSIGSITDVIDTKNGFLALDGNLRKLILWKKDGSLIGEIKVYNLFGTDYPWIRKVQVLEDGSLLFGLTQERADKSASEFLVFKVKGF